MAVILYSTGCPQCEILKEKLLNAEVSFQENNDIESIKNKGILKVPVLEVDGSQMGFSEANSWINALSS